MQHTNTRPSADLFLGVDESLKNERRAQFGCHNGHTLFRIAAWKSCWNVAAHLPHEAAMHSDRRTRITLIQIWTMFVCLFAWGLTALSAQIGYIAP